MNRHSRAAACLLAGGVLWVIPYEVQSGETPSPRLMTTAERIDYGPTLQAAVDAAWRRAVRARESEALRARAAADDAAARRSWAAPPSVEVQHRDDRLQSNVGRRETEVAIAWPMWLPGQRSASEALARAGVDRADSSLRAARLQVAGLVRESGWRLIAEASERALIGSQVDALHKLHLDVELRVRAGDLARADAMAARAEWLSARAQLADAESRLGESRIRWHELTGLRTEPTRRSMSEPTGTADGESVHPELDAATQSVAYARRRVELVRSSMRDHPELKFGLRQDASGGVEGTHNSVMVGVRVPLGTPDRNRPLEAAALGDLDVAQALEERLRQRVQADAAAARSALDAAHAQLAVEQERAKLLRERASLVDRAFRAGEAALPDLLRAIGSASQAEAAAVRQEVHLERARARLQQAIGIQP